MNTRVACTRFLKEVLVMTNNGKEGRHDFGRFESMAMWKMNDKRGNWVVGHERF
jgi:hypothetical protein